MTSPVEKRTDKWSHITSHERKNKAYNEKDPNDHKKDKPRPHPVAELTKKTCNSKSQQLLYSSLRIL